MVKFIIFGVNFLILCLVMVSAREVWAQDGETKTARAYFGFSFSQHQWPSSVRNKSEFEIARLLVAPKGQIEEGLEWEIGLKLAPERETDSGAYVSLLESASLKQKLSSDVYVKLGQFVPQWIGFERHHSLEWMRGDKANSMLSRYGFFHLSDLGIEVEKSESWGAYFLTLQNGEGPRAAEAGASKDIALSLKYKKTEAPEHEVMLTLQRGRYDLIEPEVATKSREVLQYSYNKNFTLVSVSWFRGSDPVDAINGQVLDSVDLSARGGEVAVSQGYSLELTLPVQCYDLFLRADHVDPDLNLKANSVDAKVIGLGFSPSKKINLILTSEIFDYQKEHALNTKDIARTSLTVRAGF